MSAYLQTLPQALQNEISKYLFLADRKSRLLGKLMLLDNLKRDRKENLIKQFSRDFNNKSFINDWKQFNISHSGELVVFCSGSDMLGVDVEKKALLSWDDYSLFLHPAEQEYIRKANNTVDALYSIQTKKEAFLKAVGIDLLKGLNDHNCVNEYLHYDGSIWLFDQADMGKDYACSLCHRQLNGKVTIGKFSLRD